MNIVYLSQFKDTSGYAAAARSYLKALEEHLQSFKNNVTLKLKKNGKKKRCYF